MPWSLLTLPEFDAWMRSLGKDDQDSLDACLEALREKGPGLGRPTVDRIAGSRHHNMKELRAQGTLRAFFAFDPKSKGILLIGGDKRGDKDFYDRLIPVADELYDAHLEELEFEEKKSKAESRAQKKRKKQKGKR